MHNSEWQSNPWHDLSASLLPAICNEVDRNFETKKHIRKHVDKSCLHPTDLKLQRNCRKAWTRSSWENWWHFTKWLKTNWLNSWWLPKYFPKSIKCVIIGMKHANPRQPVSINSLMAQSSKKHTYLFLWKSFLSEQKLGHRLRGVLKEPAFLQIFKTTLGIKIKLLDSIK